MDTMIETVLAWLLSAVQAYPPAAVYLGVATSIAAFILLTKPLVTRLVEYTTTDVDDTVWRWVLWLANLLTSKKVVRGSKAKPPAIDPETHRPVTADDDVLLEN